nr:zinc finger protein 423-like [Dermatophagoides farinae]
MEESRNDLLKFFIQYNDESVPQIMQIPSQLSEKSSEKFIEQLKQFINLLLHFRYMSMYMKKHLDSMMDDKSVEPSTQLAKSLVYELSEDIQFCSEKFAQLIDSSSFFDFVHKRERFYLENMDSYFPFKRDNCQSGNKMTVFNEHHNQNDSIAVELIPNDIVVINHEPDSTHNSNDDSASILTDQSHHQINLLYSNPSQSSSSQPQDVHATLLDGLLSSADNQQHHSTDNLSQTQATKRPPNDDGDKRRQSKRSRSSTKVSTIEQEDDQSTGSIGTTATDLLLVEFHCQFEGCRYRSKSLSQVKDHENRRHVQQVQPCQYEGCKAVFNGKEELDSHMSNEHLNLKLQCEIDGCEQLFPNVSRLRQHIKDEHRPSTICSNPDGATDHFTCRNCGKSFARRKYLHKHIKRMHDNVEKASKKKSTTKGKKPKSVSEDLPYSPTSGSNEADDNDDDDDDDGDDHDHDDGGGSNNDKDDDTIEIGDDNCDNEKQELLSKSKKKSTSIFECSNESCAETFTEKSKLNQHVREKHRIEYLTCKFCDKLCPTRNSLTNHIWIMHEEGEYRCPFENCDFTSKFRRNLLNHKKLRHQRHRKCPICGELIIASRFQRHKSSLHKIKNYTCSWPDCGKAFADNSALKNHVRIHLNFKRFKCKWPDCGYASEQRFTVITHIRVCHFKLPRTKKKQMELNIVQDEQTQNPYDYLETCREDICI